MKYYLRIIIPLFVFATVYSLLSMFFGQKGFFAHQQLVHQRDILAQHVQTLSNIGENLTIRIANLSSDPETIAAYAHELGYIHKNERLIKLLHFSGTFDHNEEPGELYSVVTPHFMSNDLCKTIALSAAFFALLCEFIILKFYAYSKK